MRSRNFIRTTVIITLAIMIWPIASADTVTLNPVRDNTLFEPIRQEDFADRSNGAGPTMFTGKVKDADADPGPGTRPAVRRAVLAFDIAGSIPAGSTINSVQFRMYADKVKLSQSFPISLRRLNAGWGEGTSNTGNSQQGRGEPPTPGDATWRHRFYPDQFWTTPGGDFSTTSSASIGVGGTGFYTWGSTSGMVADVQQWLNNPSQNFGWLVLGDESRIETAKRFATRESTGSTGGVSWRPRLVVDYTPQVISGACCQGSTCSVVTPAVCTGLGGTYQGDGSSCSPNPCVVFTGACCAPSGLCSVATQSACVAGGGVYQGDESTCSIVDCPVQLTPYLDPLPIPAVATPVTGSPGGAATYDISMVEFEQQLHAELPNPTRVWGYADGTAPVGTPGPVIEARSGMPVTVNWRNDIRDFVTNALRRDDHYLAVDVQTDPNGRICIHGAEARAKTVVHLHGGHVPAAVDGYPEWTSLPGDPAEAYLYPNDQQAGYLWFHDHALGITRLNVQMGLAGLYLMRDSVEDALNLPAGPFEVPLVMQDRKFHPDGSIRYPSVWMDHWFGDKVMVNGKVWPYLEVRRGKYRLRLLNGSGSRVYTLSLAPPSGLLSFTVIGTEGGLLEAPVPGVGQLTIGPGERYDVVVDFSAYANGDRILLQNSAGAPFPNGPVNLTRVMQFRVTSPAGHTDPLPAALRPIERLLPASAVMTRDFQLKQSGTDGCGRQVWEINGLHWDDITEFPELGTTEIWRFVNDSGVAHPMHMHLVFFQILDRNTFTKDPNGTIIPGPSPQPPLPEENGWKDTVMVGPGELVRVIARFEDYKGRYAYHCHILEHEDHEMMRQFQTVSCGDAEIDPTEGCDDGAANGSGASCCSSFCAPRTIGATCDDGDACTLDDLCAAGGVCVPGVPVGPPGEVVNVRFTNATTFSWDAVPGAIPGTVYDVARGVVAQLPVGSGAGETCHVSGSPAGPAVDTADPPLGSSFWYVVRARHACGTGSYGTTSTPPGGERVTSVCAP